MRKHPDGQWVSVEKLELEARKFLLSYRPPASRRNPQADCRGTRRASRRCIRSVETSRHSKSNGALGSLRGAEEGICAGIEGNFADDGDCGQSFPLKMQLKSPAPYSQKTKGSPEQKSNS